MSVLEKKIPAQGARGRDPNGCRGGLSTVQRGWPKKGSHPPGGPSQSCPVLPDADHRIKLQVFEGPLDLLLFLIRKNEIDIYDIPIESVTKQYVAVLRSMQQLDLEVAGEFFVMAASLMEIKSRMLLPKGQAAIDPNADEDQED